MKIPRMALYGTLYSKPGKREELVSILIEASEILKNFPGCIQYLVGVDNEDGDLIRISEIWTGKEAHSSSLENREIRKLIEKAIPLLGKSPEKGIEFTIIGGHIIN